VKAACVVVFVLAASTAGSAQGSAHTSTSLTPVALTPHAVAFWNEDRGLIGTGQRLSHGGSSGAILLTSNGGHTTRIAARTPGFVSWVGVAPRGHAWAVVNVCKGDDECSRRLWHSEDGGVRWRVIGPAPFWAASFVDGQRGFAVYRLESGLIATTDGGRTWRSVPSPCATDATGVSFASPQRGWLLCVRMYGLGNAWKAIYRTGDGGKHWRQIALAKFGGRHVSGLCVCGYPEGIAFARDGLGVLWESRGTIYLTRDGGAHWKGFPDVSEAELDFGWSGAAVPGQAFVLLARTPVRPIPFRLLTTTDRSTAWRTVHTWRWQG
jgi:photosystem II stability/assembly factor-like uncharacterized protein